MRQVGDTGSGRALRSWADLAPRTRRLLLGTLVLWVAIAASLVVAAVLSWEPGHGWSIPPGFRVLSASWRALLFAGGAVGTWAMHWAAPTRRAWRAGLAILLAVAAAASVVELVVHLVGWVRG